MIRQCRDRRWEWINQSLCTGGRALAPGKNRVLYGIGERGVSVANCDGEFNHKQMIENWWWDSDKNLFNKELLMKIIHAKWRHKNPFQALLDSILVSSTILHAFHWVTLVPIYSRCLIDVVVINVCEGRGTILWRKAGIVTQCHAGLSGGGGHCQG